MFPVYESQLDFEVEFPDDVCTLPVTPALNAHEINPRPIAQMRGE